MSMGDIMGKLEIARNLWGWTILVKKRDKCCVVCGESENLHAHHIIPKSIDSGLLLVVSNGVTLCEACHEKAHGLRKGYFKKLHSNDDGRPPKHIWEARQEMREIAYALREEGHSWKGIKGIIINRFPEL